MATLLPEGKQSFTDGAGLPLVGGMLYTYDAGTNTPRATYADAAGTTPNTNPVILDARGEATVFWNGAYKVVLKTASDVTVWTVDAVATPEVAGVSAALQSALANPADASEGPGMMAFAPPLNYLAKTIGAAVEDNAVNILWFCTEAQRAAIKAKTFADDHTAIFNAAKSFALGRAIYMPAGGYKISAATLSLGGQCLYGDGPGATVIRHTDPTQNLFNITGDKVTIRDMELHGAATAATTSRFAISTALATPVTGIRVENVFISGQDAAHGFTNGIKFDDGCHYGRVFNCNFDRLWGNASGFGYGILGGNVKDLICAFNTWIGSPGRGRHGVYFSSGANRCQALHNHLEGADYEAITMYSQGAQPACTDNVAGFNTIIGSCAAIPGVISGGISVFGHASGNQIVGNTIRNSKGCGIKLEGTGFTDLQDTTITGNKIFTPDYIGIDLVAAVGGEVSGNFIKDVGQAASGTYAGVRFIADGTTGTSGWIAADNRIPASSTGRSAFQTNASLPVPKNIKFDGNHVGSGTATDYEFAGGAGFPIDGRVRFSQAYDPPNIANNSSSVANWSVAGAAVGDIVTVTHSANTDGCSLSGQVVAENSVDTTIVNASGGAKDIAAGTIYIDVWKRSP
jgi:parallel beta-helix repeat protein